MGVSRKQSMPNFPKNEGEKKSGCKELSFFGKFGMLLLTWNTHFKIRPFALLPTKYYYFMEIAKQQ